MKRRSEAATTIQRWFRIRWIYFSGSLKKRRMEAVKVVEAHMKSYQVFMKNREELYMIKLKRNFLFFAKLREGLLTKAQGVIREHWLNVRDNIRKRREEQRNMVKRALRKFTVDIYIKAKRNLEIIRHFRKYRRTPYHRSWS